MKDQAISFASGTSLKQIRDAFGLGNFGLLEEKKNPSNCWVNEDFVLQDDEVYIFVKPQGTVMRFYSTTHVLQTLF